VSDIPPLDDILSGLMGANKKAQRPEKGVQIHGHRLDGDGPYYVKAADVAELLELNGVLPGIAAKLRKADQ